MPAITLSKDRFSQFIERPITVDEMVKWLPWLGLDIADVGPDYVKVEYNPNRLDFSSYAGIARAFCGLRGWKVGLPDFEVKSGEIVLKVDPSVEAVRPYVLGAVVRDLRLDSDAIKEIMDMQEDIHWGVGRNRRKVSIGVHDMDKVSAPFFYTTGDPSTKFVPLGCAEEMNLKEILEKHEKGIVFGYILAGAERYPLIVDGKGRICSFPPIINSELTKVTDQTRNLFIDITGTDFVAISRGLNIFVTALHDMGGKLESVRIAYPDRTIVSPDLRPEKRRLRLGYSREISGLDLSEKEAIRSLEKCRLGVRKVEEGVLEVTIPAYRIDIMHEIDLVEEVLIGYGYYRIEPTLPPTPVTGEPHEVSQLIDYIRQVMIGLGFTEAVNFLLTNEEAHYRKLRMRVGKAARLANPVSAEYSIVRESLLPSLISNLAHNKHERYPQRLFEVSDTIMINRRRDVATERRLHVAGIISHASASFTEIRSSAEALLANLGVTKWEIKEKRHPSFIAGRSAAIYVRKLRVGILGEIHPEVLNNFELENPTCAFEIDVDRLMK